MWCTSVGCGSGGTDSESGYKLTQTDILSFIHQCVQCGKDEVSLKYWGRNVVVLLLGLVPEELIQRVVINQHIPPIIL